MGQLVNATAFRLGYSKKWITSWTTTSKLYKQYLQEDFLIFRFIKLFFTQYTLPVFTQIWRRTEIGQKNNKISGEANLIANQFIDLKFIFSNVSVSRSHFLGISSYFLDILLEDWRLNFVKTINNASLTFFKPQNLRRRKPKNFIDLKFFPRLFNKTFNARRYKRISFSKAKFLKAKKKNNFSKAKKKNKFSKAKFLKAKFSKDKFLKAKFLKAKKKITRYKSRYTRRFIRYTSSRRRKAIRLVRYSNKYRARSKKIKSQIIRKRVSKYKYSYLSFFPIMLYDTKYYATPRSPIKNCFKFVRACLEYFHLKYYSWKQQYFITILLKNALLSTFQNTRFVPRLRFFKVLNSLILREFSFKHLNFYYFKKIFQERFLIFQGAGSAIYSSIKSFDKNNIIKLSFFGMHVRNISASFITNYIIIKLGQYFTISQILKPIVKRLKKASYLNGFRIIVAGRITRRERAAYLVRRSGDVTLAKKSCVIDYAADFKIMRFGVVGVKVWFHLIAVKPYYYVFKFTYKKIK